MESGIEEVQPRGRNGLGIAGFVLSLTCCLSIPGVILSLIALRGSPKIFAILGLIIGLPIASIELTILFKQDQAGYVLGERAGQFFEGAFDSAFINIEATKFREAHGGRFPATTDELTGLEKRFVVDPWGRPYDLEPIRDRNKPSTVTLRIVSRGPDGIADTPDDVAWPPVDNPDFETIPPDELEKEIESKPEGK